MREGTRSSIPQFCKPRDLFGPRSARPSVESGRSGRCERSECRRLASVVAAECLLSTDSELVNTATRMDRGGRSQSDPEGSVELMTASERIRSDIRPPFWRRAVQFAWSIPCLGYFSAVQRTARCKRGKKAWGCPVDPQHVRAPFVSSDLGRIDFRLDCALRRQTYGAAHGKNKMTGRQSLNRSAEVRLRLRGCWGAKAWRTQRRCWPQVCCELWPCQLGAEAKLSQRDMGCWRDFVLVVNR